MLTSRQKQRAQLVMILAGLGLAVYYLLVFRPLTERVQALDEPLKSVWAQLVAANLENTAIEGLDLEKINESLRQVRGSFQELETAREQVAVRIALEPEILARMHEPLQLVQFQNEKQARIEKITRLAGQNKVQLQPAVLAGFPEYTGEQKEPSLLWAQLSIVHHLLATAIQSAVPDIQEIELLPVRSYRPAQSEQARLHEFPIRIEMTGPMSRVSRFLVSLPLRAGEVQALGLPEPLPAKPALFIEKIMVRKQSPTSPDEVRLDLTVSGFVYRNQ